MISEENSRFLVLGALIPVIVMLTVPAVLDVLLTWTAYLRKRSKSR